MPKNMLLKALGDVVQLFEDELYKKISKTQLEDAFAEIAVKKIDTPMCGSISAICAYGVIYQ